MATRQKPIEPEQSFLSTTESKESFIRELKMIYENATNTEIERALNWVMEQFNPPYNKSEILKKIRIKLED
jgi:hypothetical protein